MDKSPNIFLLEKQPSLTPQESKKITDAAQACADKVCADLEISWPVNITIYPNADWAMAETGEGGYTPTEDWCQIYLDVTGKKYPLELILGERLPVAIYHEMNHLKRWHATGYGTDLPSSLVTEGLASVYERAMVPAYCSPWLSYSQENIEGFLVILRKNREKAAAYVHSEWFFGSNPDIPKQLGYSVGHYIVSQALANNPSSRLIDLMDKSADEIIKLSAVEL